MGYMLEEGPQKAPADHITPDVEGTAVPAYHARPDGEALGGVVLSPDLAGLRPLIEDHCRRLATHGLAVCAPETFARLIPPGGALDMEGRRARAGELHHEGGMGDPAGAADHLAAAGGAGSASGMGTCMGRAITLNTATTG